MNDSFQELRLTQSNLDVSNKAIVDINQEKSQLEMKKLSLQIELESLKIKYEVESKAKQQLSQIVNHLKKSEQELNNNITACQHKLLVTQETLQKQKEKSLKLQQEVQILKGVHKNELEQINQQLNEKKLEINLLKQRVEDQEQLLNKQIQLKKSLVQSLVLDIQNQPQLKRVQDFEELMRVQFQLNSTIMQQNQTIGKLEAQLKKYRQKHIKAQVQISEFKQKLQSNKKQILGLSEIVLKLRQSRSKIREVFQFQDAIRREYHSYLKKYTNQVQILNKKPEIDQKIFSMIVVLGKECLDQLKLK